MTVNMPDAPTRTNERDTSITIKNLTLAGSHGDIPIRLYTPNSPRDEPIGLVWCHGGAYVYGDLDTAESHMVATLLAAAGIAVVTVDYRLAPVPQWALDLGGDPGTGRSHFPVASEEVDAVLSWADTELRTHSPNGWALGGASAGGTITAGAALRLRDHGAAAPSRLLLVYPLLHAKLPVAQPALAALLDATPPQPGIPLSSEVVELLTLNYVGDNSHELSNPYAFPGGHDLSGLPPTLIINSDADTIRASGEVFAAELRDAGVDVVACTEPGTLHGHLNSSTSEGGRRTINRMIAWLTNESNANS